VPQVVRLSQEAIMAEKKDTALAPARDPFGLWRQVASELDRVFEDGWTGFRWPAFARTTFATPGFVPHIDVFQKEGRLVTKVDLPGLKKEDVKVEVTDGHLAISGERRTEAEEKKEHFYRTERSYGSFYRAVPLPEGVKLEDVKATFTDGVLEVSVPLPASIKATPRRIEIEDGGKAPKAA
jgi:HSP20 family protein